MQIYLPIAELPIDIFVLLAIGAGVGLLSGMFGVGGGFLTTPLLILAGVPPPVAVATEANQIVGSSVSGALAHWRRQAVDLTMGAVLVAGGLCGAALGVFVFKWLRGLGQVELLISLAYVFFLGTIGALMLAESLRAWRARRAGHPFPARRPGQHNWLHGLPLRVRFRRSRLYISVAPPVLLGMTAGFLAAIMGVGGGFILVPAMIYLLRMPTNVVIGTSLFQIIFVTAFVTLLHAAQNQTVDIVLAALLLLGAAVGAQIGAQIALGMRAEQLRAGLAVLVLLVGAALAWGLTARPDDLFTLQMMRAGPP